MSTHCYVPKLIASNTSSTFCLLYVSLVLFIIIQKFLFATTK